MTNVKNKWALITGASRGIGRLVALELARRGCNLILHSRNAAHCNSLLTEVQALGIQAYAIGAELSEPAAVEQMLSEIDALHVPVAFILNNAGVQIAYRNEFLQTPVSDYTQSFQINTIAPMMICYHFLPKMQAQGFGRIVNTTSGITLDPQQAGYSASKAALDKVTIDLGSKYDGSDIMLSLTDPGWCRTDLGGPHAPNAPEDALPGVLIGVFADDRKSGRCFAAPNYIGMTLEAAVEKAQATLPSPY